MSFRIISVTGAHSSAGKTTLCSILLKELEGFGAIKYTKTSLYTSITDDPAIILEKDKDTAIMSESGAERVVWIQSSGSELKNALAIAMNKMHGLRGVVVEGNSPALLLKPDLTIFVVGQEGLLKPSAEEACKEANIVILNSSETAEPPPSLTALIQHDAPVFRIDLAQERGEIDKFLEYTKKYIQ